MTYSELVYEIKNAAEAISNINSFTTKDVYEAYNEANIEYSNIAVGLETANRTSNTIQYNCIIYYADRLLQDASNKLAIHDDGIRNIQAILNMLPDEISYNTPVVYTTFEQEFSHYLAGVYARITFEVEFDFGACDIDIDTDIPDVYLIRENGVYKVDKYDYVQVDVEGRKDPVLQSKDASAYANSDREVKPDEGYDGLDKVTIKGIKAMDAETTIT